MLGNLTPKKILFFLLMPIYVPLALLLNATFDWWTELPKNGRRFLFIILLPFYAPFGLLMNADYGGFNWWAKLAE